jgi:hypothetical protein
MNSMTWLAFGLCRCESSLRRRAIMPRSRVFTSLGRVCLSRRRVCASRKRPRVSRKRVCASRRWACASGKRVCASRRRACASRKRVCASRRRACASRRWARASRRRARASRRRVCTSWRVCPRYVPSGVQLGCRAAFSIGGGSTARMYSARRLRTSGVSSGVPTSSASSPRPAVSIATLMPWPRK